MRNLKKNFNAAAGAILITNKSVDKKSAQNPYMQDFVQIFCTLFNWFLIYPILLRCFLEAMLY